MYSPEGQNKTIPLFLQEKQGELLFFNFIFSSSVLCQNQDFLYPSIHVRHAKLADFCICTLICITLCFICSDSYVM